MKTKREVTVAKERDLVLEHSRKQWILFALYILLTIAAMA
jgi:hypothetical protein